MNDSMRLEEMSELQYLQSLESCLPDSLVRERDTYRDLGVRLGVLSGNWLNDRDVIDSATKINQGLLALFGLKEKEKLVFGLFRIKYYSINEPNRVYTIEEIQQTLDGAKLNLAASRVVRTTEEFMLNGFVLPKREWCCFFEEVKREDQTGYRLKLRNGYRYRKYEN